MVEVPVGEGEAERDRDRRLEDHRAGDVAEREAVLAVADPEEAVGLLGQLGRQRREHEREHQRLDADVLGDRDQLLDEEVRAADDRRQADDELQHDRRRCGGSSARCGRSRGARSPRPPGPRPRRAASGGRRRRRRATKTTASGIRRPSGSAEAGSSADARKGQEEAQVAVERRRRRPSSSGPCGAASRRASAETPTSAIAIVASRKGAPMIAPTATSSEPAAPPMIATIGISVSGIAVPTAASRLPVAPSPSPSRWPAHSIALVKSERARRGSPRSWRAGETTSIAAATRRYA